MSHRAEELERAWKKYQAIKEVVDPGRFVHISDATKVLAIQRINERPGSQDIMDAIDKADRAMSVLDSKLRALR
jgi:hypothetical protein